MTSGIDLHYHTVSKYKVNRNAIKGQGVDLKVTAGGEFYTVSSCSETDFICLRQTRQETLYMQEEGLYKDLALMSSKK
jgi:hypothetical protein